MATGINSDVLPVRKATKAELSSLKGGATYDEVVNVLLELVPEELVRARLRPRSSRTPRPESSWREPEKQRLTAHLAAESWAAWRRQARVADRGPRAVAYFPKIPEKRSPLVSSERRGLPP